MLLSKSLCQPLRWASSSSAAASGQMIQELIDKFSGFQPSPLTLKNFIDLGIHHQTNPDAMKTSFKFLRMELPVRLANIMKEIELLPPALQKMPSTKIVKDWYLQSFTNVVTFRDCSHKDSDALSDFTETLLGIRNKHIDTVETMAQGVIEMRDTYGINLNAEHSIQYFLDRFYMQRIGIRMLINQHVTLFGKNAPGHPKRVGAIQIDCDVASVIEDAYSSARFLCEQYYLAAPELKMNCINSRKPNDPILVTYVPSHLYHIAFELFKNSMRAIVENTRSSVNDENFDPVKVTIVLGAHDLSIKINDTGGGIPRQKLPLLFNYMYSTAPDPSKQANISSSPLAGYGYGLPLSRLYAKYFQGDLILTTMEGLGVEALVYLKVLPKDAAELLPIFNKQAIDTYKRGTTASDWSSTTVSKGKRIK